MIARRLRLALLAALASTATFASGVDVARAAGPEASACADAAEQGQELRAARKLVAARARFVTCAQRECPVAVRDSCTEWLADVDRRMPSVVVDAKDNERHDLRAVVVSLDGAALPATATSVAVPLDPGAHTIRCEAAGYETKTEEIVIREGEPVRVVACIMQASAVTASPPPVVVAPPPSRPFPVVPVVLGSVSLVALGVFAVVGATAASDYRSLERDCAPSCSSDRIDSLRTRFVVADVSLVLGIVSGVAAGAFWLFDRPAAAEPAKTAR